MKPNASSVGVSPGATVKPLVSHFRHAMPVSSCAEPSSSNETLIRADCETVRLATQAAKDGSEDRVIGEDW